MNKIIGNLALATPQPINPLHFIMEDIIADAQIRPDRYLEDSIVPEGGE